MALESIKVSQIANSLLSLRSKISVSSTFADRMIQINKLLDNDKTSIVNTTLDFMIHCGSTKLKIETKNPTLNTILEKWQKKILNKNISIDIPRGLRALSAQNYKERWKSSFLVLNVNYETFDFGSDGIWELPSQMWFSAGESVIVDGNTNKLDGKKYYLGNKENEIRPSKHKDVFIRKPYNSWYEDYPTPYLVRRGTLFNGLLKQAIVAKQTDVIESLIPYLLKVQAGNDAMAARGELPTQDELEDLVESIRKAKQTHTDNNGYGDLIAPLAHDVNLEHFMPELIKIFNPEIVKSVDKDLLASLGWVELEGFSNNRQQTILNPKVLVEEIKDGVLDWAALLEEVMENTLERNTKKHPTLANQPVRVIPGTIKAFVSDDMRSMLRSMYDRGIISKQTGVEDIADIDFEVEVDRRTKETERNLDTLLNAPIIQNLEQYDEPSNVEDQDKKPGSPEGDNFNQALLEGIKIKNKAKNNKENHKGIKKEVIIYKTIDELPDEIKSSLSIPEQVKYIKNLKN